MVVFFKEHLTFVLIVDNMGDALGKLDAFLNLFFSFSFVVIEESSVTNLSKPSPWSPTGITRTPFWMQHNATMEKCADFSSMQQDPPARTTGLLISAEGNKTQQLVALSMVSRPDTSYLMGQGDFSLAKGTSDEEFVNFYWDFWKGTKAKTRGNGGNCLRCVR